MRELLPENSQSLFKNREQTAAKLSGLWWLGLQRLGLWRPYLAVPNPSSPQPISVPFSHLKISRSQQLGTSTPCWKAEKTSRTMVLYVYLTWSRPDL